MRRVPQDPVWGGWVPVPQEPRGPWWWFLRHRTEIGLTVVLGAVPAGVWAIRFSPLDVGVVTLVLGTLLAVPDARRFLWGQFRRIVVERRMRAAFRESGPCTRNGLVATPIRSSATPGGDTVVWLWCPAGLPVDDVVAARSMLAEACFVDEVVVERHRRWANVAVLTFVRGVLGPRA